MPRRVFSRRLLAGGAAAAAITPVAVSTASQAAAEKSGVTRSVAGEGGTVRRVKLYAEKLADGQMGYGLEKGKATIPGPLIELIEGDTLHIEFENTMDVAASVHVHGLDYDIANDGTALNRSTVEPGGKRTYTWRTNTPGKRADGTYRPGSAGYWHYHDHVVGTEHGTGGIRSGLYGPVVVRRKGDVLPDPGKQFTIVFNDLTINNKKGTAAPNFEATVGDRVEIIMITHGEHYHTFHIHGHRWADNRTGILQGPDDHSRVIDNKITGPADAFGFQIVAGEGVGAGAWMYHCHVQSHSDMGMAGLFLVAKEDGTIPGYEPHHLSSMHSAHQGGRPRPPRQGQGGDRMPPEQGTAEAHHH
ncbi:multicopper oxidase domain-containing protein [Streptomyces pathocidini]|uniref:Multicopper oxidase domain-containing protein n=1 Tax=Streptomyces pathocidini TaxID=1650571 RepID=A0ABW7UK24_9ACTN